METIPTQLASTIPVHPDTDLARRAAGGCVESRNVLVASHLPFLIRLAGEFRGRGVPHDDLVNEGALGLIEAARRFDADRGYKFLTFASWWARKAMRKAVRDGRFIVPMPGSQRRRLRELREAESELHHELGRQPDEGELSARTGRSLDRLRKTLDERRFEFRIDAPAGTQTNTTWAELLRDDRVDCPEGEVLRREIRDRLLSEVDRLEYRERQIVRWRFGLGDDPPMSLQDISAKVGLSRERIRQIETLARRKLWRRLTRGRLAPLH